jgi:hypothetical protein
MRFSVRCALVVLVAALAAGAGAANAAAEAPFFKVEGKRLETGQSRELKFKDSTEYKFEFGGKTISCPQMSALAGAKIVGATIEATLNFGVCKTARLAGEGCTVELKTRPLVGTLVFSQASGLGPIDVLFRTVSGNKIIIGIKFLPTCNVGGELFIEGTALAAEALGSKSEKIYVGEEPAEAKIAHLGFPSARITTVWEAEKVGKEEKLKEVKIKEMITLTETFFMQGASEWSLVKEEAWGIYT